MIELGESRGLTNNQELQVDTNYINYKKNNKRVIVEYVMCRLLANK